MRQVIVLAALALALLLPGRCTADVFGGFSLASESVAPPWVCAGEPSRCQQADYARDAAISGDGRYVAFDGSYGGATGVWRRDLQTGIVEPVALGTAQLPSISESGRYISFTSTAPLAPGDHNEGPDVYVRDMALEMGQPGAFTLVSAVNGSQEGLSYQPNSEPASYGALASGRSALSADGREVVFVTTAVSNLADPESVNTPAMQVAVRYLDTDVTRLVSVVQPASEGQPAEPVSSVEGARTIGAVYASGGVPPPFSAQSAYPGPRAAGASISADGSTVAWLGQNVSLQAQVLSGETLKAIYTEPLWRRIADGPTAPTRRVTGGSDPADPACAASGETAVSENTPSAADPCQGPFATFTTPTSPGTWAGGIGDPVPLLSADGGTVAFLATAPLVASGSAFGQTEGHSNVYVAHMSPGLTRDQALGTLTELASGQGTDLATNAPIVDLGFSPDGSEVAFTTMRTVFPLGSPAYVSAPSAVPGMVELFDVDLANETLTRVTHGFEGGPSEHPHAPKPPSEDPYTAHPADGALSPSFSSDGNEPALSSTASNLVFGDGNTPLHESNTFDGSDAFVVPRLQFPPTPTESYISSAPPGPSIVPDWRLGVTALSRRDGSVLLEVTVPGAGALRTGAKASVRVIVASPARSSTRRHRRARTHATVANRTVASRGATPPGAGLVAVTLKLASRYSSLAVRRGGLSATVSLSFSASGHPTLRETVLANFRRTVKSRSRSRSRKAHRRVIHPRRR